MRAPNYDEDVRAIEALIDRQFASLSWARGEPADWERFAADFVDDAPLYAAARPAQGQSVRQFIERMKGLAGTGLYSFHETVLGTEVRIFGNVAVALAGCEITENDTDVSRSVEALLLIKDEGRWRIAAQAWDGENDANPLPPDLTQGRDGDR